MPFRENHPKPVKLLYPPARLSSKSLSCEHWERGGGSPINFPLLYLFSNSSPQYPSHFRRNSLYLFAHGSTLIRETYKVLYQLGPYCDPLGPSTTNFRLHPFINLVTNTPHAPHVYCIIPDPGSKLSRPISWPAIGLLKNSCRHFGADRAKSRPLRPTSSHLKSERVFSNPRILRTLPLLAVNPS